MTGASRSHVREVVFAPLAVPLREPFSIAGGVQAIAQGVLVTVKLVEAAPVAGALRFEVLSEGRYDHGQRGQRVPRRKERNEPGGPKNRRGRQQNRRQQRQR